MFTMTIKVQVDGDEERMRQLLKEYLTSKEAPLWQDYGPNAWGGWDGPTLIDVEVVE